jgi:hypothetical protein
VVKVENVILCRSETVGPVADDLGLVVEPLNSTVRDRHVEIGEDALLMPFQQESEVLHRFDL